MDGVRVGPNHCNSDSKRNKNGNASDKRGLRRRHFSYGLYSYGLDRMATAVTSVGCDGDSNGEGNGASDDTRR